MADVVDWVALLIKHWDTIKNIPPEIWGRMKEAFRKGNKELGFIRRKSKFLEYCSLSQSTFLKKYARFIIPTDYRGYLLHAIHVSQLYERGLKIDGDIKRKEMFEINPRALRLYNLYNCGILFVILEKIDKMIAEGKTEAEITGVASKMLDDLMTDKSIIYVHQLRNKDELYQAIKSQLRATKYCLIFGSGKDNISTIQHIFLSLTNDKDVSDFTTEHNQRRIGDIDHFSLAIFQKTRVMSPEE